MSARAHLLATATLVALAVAWAAPACARQEPGRGPGGSDGATQATREVAAWQERLAGVQARLQAAPADAGLRQRLSALLLASGRAEEAERMAAEGGDALANARGEAAYARGRVADAETAFRRAIGARASDELPARVNLGVLLARRGETAAARAQLDSVLARTHQLASPSAVDLIAAAAAARQLGDGDPRLFHEAVQLYEQAAKLDPADDRPKLEEASLFLEKYNSTDAQDLLREVLARTPGHPDALLLEARAKKFDGSDEALALVRRALAVAPDHVPARVFLAELLLGLEDYAGAAREAGRALALNPASLEALAVLAATDMLSGDDAGFQDASRRALALDPRGSALYVTAAEMAVEHRRYREAADLARRGLALDSTDWSAWAELGMNQFRLGEVAAARASLERAFKGDPFNVWVKNTLDLLDTYPQYVERAGPRVRFFLHGDEADLIALYAAPLAEEAFDSLSRRYGYRPPGPIRMEMFPRQADFSVRTVGLAGLGALGVSFGEQLAMASPAAARGESNWGATLWHELAHTFTLGASRNRVPRWLTEGLSVYEERHARPGWGQHLTLSFAQAYNRGDVLSVSRLNEGFVRPKYPEQVIHSYYEASLVVEFVEQRRGFEAIRRMLAAYGSGRAPDQVTRDVLGTTPEQLDRDFDVWVRQRFARELAAAGTGPDDPGSYLRLLSQGRQQLTGGRLEEARRTLLQARDAFPELAAPGSAYHLLADVAERAADKAEAAAELERAFALDAEDYDGIVRAARLRLAMGDTLRAAAALDAAMYVRPYDPAVHELLAAACTSLQRFDAAVRERRALVALRPVDLAGARYQLALALARAGRAAEARAEVLRALELAPDFAAAQELLLRLSGGGSRGGT